MNDPAQMRRALAAAYRASRQPPSDLLERIQDAVDADAAQEAQRLRGRKLLWGTAGLAVAAIALTWMVLRPRVPEEVGASTPSTAVYEARDDARQGQQVEAASPRPASRSKDPGSAPAVTERAPTPAPLRPKGGKGTMAPAMPAPPDAAPREEVAVKAVEESSTPSTDLADLRLLGAAERAVRRNPTRALELLQQHDEQFPRSAAALEREALTILALCGTGQIALGHERRGAFLREHPGSAYEARVKGACSQ